MRFVIPVIAAVVMINGLVVGSSAQTVSFGLVAGGYDNQDFDSLFEPGPLDVAGRPFPPTVVQPDSGGYIVGPSLEIHWSQRISLRVEALNKPLHYQDGAAFNQDNVPIGFAPNTVVTWQFPVLVKYKFPLGRLSPFLEGGPSFRLAGNLNRSDPSHVGVSAGVGVEAQWRRLRIAPRVRYTRWAEDALDLVARTRPDQLEFLAGFSYVPASDSYPLGRRISVGAVIASTVSADFRESTETHGPTALVLRTTSGPRVIVVGPMVEFQLASSLSIEVNALTRSLRGVTRFFDAGRHRFTQIPFSTGGIWEFPVLLKHRLTKSSVRPFLALGPSFRLPKRGLSIFGVTAGAGVELQLRRIKIAPGVRYTRWGPGESPGVSRNQVQILAGISF